MRRHKKKKRLRGIISNLEASLFPVNMERLIHYGVYAGTRKMWVSSLRKDLKLLQKRGEVIVNWEQQLVRLPSLKEQIIYNRNCKKH